MITCLKKILDSFESIITVMRYSHFVRLPESEQEEVFIFGNGPSLWKELKKEETLFCDKKIFCVNYMAEYQFYDILKPRYYILCDPLFFCMGKDNVPQKRIEKFIEILLQKTKWDMYLFIPYQYSKNSYIKEMITKNSNIKIKYFNMNTFPGFFSLRYRFWKWNLAAPICENVIVAAIFLSINMGYKKIYLKGVDHSWVENLNVGNDNIVYWKDIHFYNRNKKDVEKKAIYSDPDQRIPLPIHRIFQSQFILFREYHALRSYAEILNVKIFNLTPDSYIDAFKKIDYF